MAEPHLNRRLVLESLDRTSDGSGGFVESWIILGELWADVSARTGRERAVGLATVSAVPMKIIVRGAPQGAQARPRPGQRFREGTRVFAISAVTEWGKRGQYLACFADEEVAA